jgi:RND superfamily putative drug exporter
MATTGFGVDGKRCRVGHVATVQRRHRLDAAAVAMPRRHPVLVIVVFAIVAGAAWAFSWDVQSRLLGGGLDAPHTESFQARQALTGAGGQISMPMVVELADRGGSADSAEAKAAAAHVMSILDRSVDVRAVTSYWEDPQALAPYRSRVGDAALITATVAGDDELAPKRAKQLAGAIESQVHGVDVKIGGQAIIYHDIIYIAEGDLIKVELIAAPITTVFLYFVFGSLVSALLPLVVAAFSVGATNLILDAFSHFTSVSVFAASLSTPLCLALSIDYSLLLLTRYREEAADSGYGALALDRALRRAGRTILYSGAVIAPSLASLFCFPLYFLRSLAAAGLFGVLVSVMGAVVLLPAVLQLLGAGVNAGRFLRGDKVIRPSDAPSTARWMRVAAFSTARPVVVVAAVAIPLILLALPVAGIRFGSSDDRPLASGVQARQLGDDLRRDYAINVEATVTVVFPAASHMSLDTLGPYLQALSRVPDVASVSSGALVYQRGSSRSPPDPVSLLTPQPVSILSTGEPFSAAGQDQLRALRRVPAPAPVLFAGLAAQSHDNLSAIAARIPYALAIIASSTLILVGAMTRSVLLPVKSLTMNLLSLTASFGSLVWIFQNGALGGLGTTSPGYIAAHVPPLIFCVAFGLSMDYEIFLLSRIREEWLKIGKNTRESNRQAVIRGIGFTGRIVTLAATVMMVVFLTLLLSTVAYTKMLGSGLAIAVAVDAFLVRSLLVPAIMSIAGRANWWHPTLRGRRPMSEDVRVP